MHSRQIDDVGGGTRKQRENGVPSISSVGLACVGYERGTNSHIQIVHYFRSMSERQTDRKPRVYILDIYYTNRCRDVEAIEEAVAHAEEAAAHVEEAVAHVEEAVAHRE